MTTDWLWWKHGVIYQIYRSFHDSNGDRVGDLRYNGKARLSFGARCRGIGFLPINTSPMFDFGYDIELPRHRSGVRHARDFDLFLAEGTGGIRDHGPGDEPHRT